MSKIETLMRAELGSLYDPATKTYSILTPDKAAERLAAVGWTKERELVRRHANGNDEYLVILSKPIPPPPPKPAPPAPKPVAQVAAEKVRAAFNYPKPKETTRGRS